MRRYLEEVAPHQVMAEFQRAVPDEELLSRLDDLVDADFALPLHEQLANVCNDAPTIRFVRGKLNASLLIGHQFTVTDLPQTCRTSACCCFAVRQGSAV